MEVNLLEEKEDGYQAFCVILTKEEVEELQQVNVNRHLNTTLSEVLLMCIEVGMEY